MQAIRFVIILWFACVLTFARAEETQNTIQLPIEDERPAWIKADQLSYMGPTCANAWSRKDFLQYLYSEDWWPHASDNPFRQRGAYYYNTHQEEFLELLPEFDVDKTGKRRPTVSAMWSSVEPNEVKELPIQWIDLDGDGRCDAIVESYTDWGEGAQGRKADTHFYVFLQSGKGFRLIDFTPADDSPWGNGYTPEALVPLWIIGDPRPFLVARQTSMWFAARELTILPARYDGPVVLHHKEVRSSIRWNVKREDWDVYRSGDLALRGVRTVGDVISEFIQSHPPKTGGPYCDAEHWGDNNTNPGCTEPH